MRECSAALACRDASAAIRCFLRCTVKLHDAPITSSIGGTREEQLCILSAVLLWGVVAWLFTVRAARKTNNNITANDNNLEAPLLEEDEPKHAIRSRVRLAARQAAYYVLAIYYAICFLVTRCDCCGRGASGGRGSTAPARIYCEPWPGSSPRRPTRRNAGPPGDRAWPRRRLSPARRARPTRDAGVRRFHLSAPSLWALCAHAVCWSLR